MIKLYSMGLCVINERFNKTRISVCVLRSYDAGPWEPLIKHLSNKWVKWMKYLYAIMLWIKKNKNLCTATDNNFESFLDRMKSK